MVNYVRMEEVWRSYGPAEPIGPSEGSRKRRRAVKIAAGVAAVCLVSAAAGLYLKPDLERTERAEARARAAEVPAASPSRSAPASNDSLAEAEALQAQLQLAVADGAPAPVPPPSGSAPLPVPPPPPPPQAGAVPARVTAPGPAVRPAPAQPNRVQRSASAFLQSFRRTPQERPAPAQRAAPAPVAQQRQAPIVLADSTPPARTYPRYAPPARPRPAAAPVVTPPPPVAERAPAPPAPDCSGAGNAAEQMVCGSPELAALDARMEAELAAAVAAGHRPDLLQRDQSDWRRRRDAAAPDPRAVADAYRRRIGQLRSMQ